MAVFPLNFRTRRAADVASQQATMSRLAKDVIEARWRTGGVTKRSLDDALAQVNTELSPIPAAYVGARRAITAALKDFRLHLEQTGAQPPVTTMTSARLAGLGNILSDVWGVVSGAAKGAWGEIGKLFGAGTDGAPIIIEHKTDYTIPILIGVGLMAVLLLKK